MNLITILITTLNSEIDIRNFLKSLNDQTSKCFDFIIVDGGSTDKTIDVIKSSNLPYNLFVESGLGIYEGINLAIQNCKTEYYLVCGSDDLLDRFAISNINNILNSNSNFDLILFSVLKNNKVQLSKAPNFINKRLGWQSIFSSHSIGTVIRKQLHDTFGLYNTQEKILSDGIFLTEVISKTSNIGVFNITLGEFGQGGTSVINFYDNIFKIFKIQIRYYEFLPQIFLLVFRLIKYRKRFHYDC
jgi:glycosyltransferase involved in cell wall biosynthesis